MALGEELKCFGAPFHRVRAMVGMCGRGPVSIIPNNDISAGVKALKSMPLEDVGVGLPAQLQLLDSALLAGEVLTDGVIGRLLERILQVWAGFRRKPTWRGRH